MAGNNCNYSLLVNIWSYNYRDASEAMKLDSTNLAALNNLAAFCDEVNKPEETLKYLHQIIRIEPKYTSAYRTIVPPFLTQKFA